MTRGADQSAASVGAAAGSKSRPVKRRKLSISSVNGGDAGPKIGCQSDKQLPVGRKALDEPIADCTNAGNLA